MSLQGRETALAAAHAPLRPELAAALLGVGLDVLPVDFSAPPPWPAEEADMVAACLAPPNAEVAVEWGDLLDQAQALRLVERPLTASAGQAEYPLVALPPAASPLELKQTLSMALEIRRLRRTVADADKFLLAGKVTLGVLHELKNPLNNLVGAVERWLASRPDDGSLPWPAMAARNAELLRESVQEFLASFRGSDAEADLLLHPILDRAVNYAVKADAAARRIRVERRWAEPAPMVRGIGGQLLHAFLNLLVNARHAIGDDGGLLELSTEWHADGMIALEIADSGPGFSPHALATLFQPFRSQKQTGTGLGMMLCRDIVAKHGGSLRAGNRTAGRGAVVRLTLPAWPQPA